MKNFYLTILVFIALAVAAERGWEARKWKKVADYRGHLSDRTALYLFGETEVLDVKGKPMRRVDILDALIDKAVAQQRQK